MYIATYIHTHIHTYNTKGYTKNNMQNIKMQSMKFIMIQSYKFRQGGCCY